MAMPAVPLPLPPELASPEPDADAWVPALADALVAMADDAGMDPDAAGAMLADDTAEGNADHAANVPERARRWQVTDDRSAEWAMRHVAQAEAELAQLRAQADEWRQRIDTWFVQRARPLQATVGFMAGHVERYALAKREANPKAKTLTLPSGVVRTSYVAPKVEVADADEVVAWARANGLADVVRVKREPKVSELREHLTLVERAVGIRVVDDAGCVVALADGSLQLPEPGAEWWCPQCADTTKVAAVTVDAYQVVAVRTAQLDGLPPHGPLPAPVPGTFVAPERVTAKAQAVRP